MQVFVTDKNLLQCCEDLDLRRCHKQLLEVNQIIKALTGQSKAYQNHPVCLQYKNHLQFLYLYQSIFQRYWELYEKYKHKVGFSRLIDNLLKAKSRKDLEEYGETKDADPLGMTAIFVNPIANLWEDIQKAKELFPSFINQEYIDNFKARLYIKDPIYYSQWKEYFDKGLGRNNMYFVEGKYKLYLQNDYKKLIKED